MRGRSLTVFVLCTGIAAVVGCVSLGRTPEARFFALRSLPGGDGAPAAVAAHGDLIGVMTVRVPGHIDRPQLVTWAGPNELRIDEFLRWAEPLDAGVTRTLAEDLAVLLPDSRILRSPWPAAARPTVRLLVELSGFGPERDGEVRLEGRYFLLAAENEGTLLRQTIGLKRGPSAAARTPHAAGEGVELMSDLLADLARDIAGSIRRLPPDPGAASATSGDTPPTPIR